VQFYFAANFSQAAIIAPNAATFRDFFDKQDIFVFIVTVTLGASLIAQDRRVNALQIYLSKPLTRAEYIFGKLGILMTFLLFITWAPAVLLLGVQVMFAGNFSFLLANAYLLPAITLYSLLEIVMVSTSMLALSSLSTNSRFVGILYTALIFFGQALSGVLRFITGGTKLSWIAFGNDLAQVGDLIFRVPLRFDIPWPVSLLTIVGLVAVSGLILERRVRGVEIVA
jgi:ABC-2 type transport system permease protein